MLATVASFSGVVVCGLAAPGTAQEWPDRSELPLTLSPFEGDIEKTYQDFFDGGLAVAGRAARGRAERDHLLLDDVGFGQPSTFGGLIDTPELDQLASEGLNTTGSTRRPFAARRGRRC